MCLLSKEILSHISTTHVLSLLNHVATTTKIGKMSSSCMPPRSSATIMTIIDISPYLPSLYKGDTKQAIIHPFYPKNSHSKTLTVVDYRQGALNVF